MTCPQMRVIFGYVLSYLYVVLRVFWLSVEHVEKKCGKEVGVFICGMREARQWGASAVFLDSPSFPPTLSPWLFSFLLQKTSLGKAVSKADGVRWRWDGSGTERPSIKKGKGILQEYNWEGVTGWSYECKSFVYKESSLLSLEFAPGIN